MSGTGRPLTWHEIEACLRDLGDELERRGLEISMPAVDVSYLVL